MIHIGKWYYGIPITGKYVDAIFIMKLFSSPNPFVDILIGRVGTFQYLLFRACVSVLFFKKRRHFYSGRDI
jgi:hypothetical protein